MFYKLFFIIRISRISLQNILPNEFRNEGIITTTDLILVKTSHLVIARNTVSMIIDQDREPLFTTSHHVCPKGIFLRFRQSAKPMGNIQTTMLFQDILRNIPPMYSRLLCDVLHYIANTTEMTKRIDPSKTKGHPIMPDTPPGERTSKHDRMNMKSMLRGTLTLSCTLAVSNLQYNVSIRTPRSFLVTAVLRLLTTV